MSTDPVRPFAPGYKLRSSLSLANADLLVRFRYVC